MDRARVRAIYTSVKMNEYGCRDAPCEKSWKQGNPLSNTIKDTSTIMRKPYIRQVEFTVVVVATYPALIL